jgi:hypothetical protein
MGNMKTQVYMDKQSRKFEAKAKGRVISRCATLDRILKNLIEGQGIARKDIHLTSGLVKEIAAKRYKVLPIAKAMTLAELDNLPQQMKRGIAPGTGKMVEVAVGTPLCCDPTSETYWSM